LSILDRKVTNRLLALAKAALLSRRCRAEAVIPPIGDKATQETTYDAAQVAGLGRIFF
jgi:hypothetical protein